MTRAPTPPPPPQCTLYVQGQHKKIVFVVRRSMAMVTFLFCSCAITTYLWNSVVSSTVQDFSSPSKFREVIKKSLDCLQIHHQHKCPLDLLRPVGSDPDVVCQKNSFLKVSVSLGGFRPSVAHGKYSVRRRVQATKNKAETCSLLDAIGRRSCGR